MGYSLSIIILRTLSMEYRSKVYREFLSLLDQVGIRDYDMHTDWVIAQREGPISVVGHGIEDQGFRYLSDLELSSTQGFGIESVGEVLNQQLGTQSILDL